MKIMEMSHDANINCPFCQKVVAENSTHHLEECPHTLLITTDNEVKFGNDYLGVDLLDEDEAESEWGQVLADSADPRLIMIKTYQPPSSNEGAYYLFKR